MDYCQPRTGIETATSYVGQVLGSPLTGMWEGSRNYYKILNVVAPSGQITVYSSPSMWR